MEKLKKATILAAALSALLIVAFGAAAPAAAQCGELCRFHTGLCQPTPNHPEWGCGNAGSYCYDIQCWVPSFAAGEVERIGAAAEAGDMELARKLAEGYPSLRIMKAGQMIFDGPKLAGIAGPEDSPEGIRVACAGKPAAAPAATPAEASAAEPAETTEQK